MAEFVMKINNSNNAHSNKSILASNHYNYIQRKAQYSPNLLEANEIELLNNFYDNKVEKTKSTSHENYIQRKKEFANREEYEDLVYEKNANMPTWAKESPSDFWLNADLYEVGNRISYHSFVLSLPHEFSDEENINLVNTYCDEIFKDEFVYSLGLHKKTTRDGKKENPHVHIMFSDRKLDGIDRAPEIFFKRANTKNPHLGGAKKDRKWTSIYSYKRERKNWERILNNALEKKGLEKVSCESLEKQLELAREEKDILKEIYLNRTPINCPGNILQKIDKAGIESLTKNEKRKYEKYQQAIQERDLALATIEKIKNLQIENYEEKTDLSLEKNAKLFSVTENIITARSEKLLLERKKVKSEILTDYDNELLDQKYYGVNLLARQEKYKNEKFSIKRGLVHNLITHKRIFAENVFFTKENEEKLNSLNNLNLSLSLENYYHLANLKKFYNEKIKNLEAKRNLCIDDYTNLYNKITFDYNIITLKEKLHKENELEKYDYLILREQTLADEIESMKVNFFNKGKFNKLKEELEKVKLNILSEKENIQENIIDKHFKQICYHTQSRWNFEPLLKEKWQKYYKEISKVDDEIEKYKLSYEHIDDILNQISKNKDSKQLGIFEISKNKTKTLKPINKSKDTFIKIEQIALTYGKYLINHMKLKNAIQVYNSDEKIREISSKTNKETERLLRDYRVYINDLLKKEEILKNLFDKLKIEISKTDNIKFLETNMDKVLEKIDYLKTSKEFIDNKLYEHAITCLNSIKENKNVNFYNTEALKEEAKALLKAPVRSLRKQFKAIETDNSKSMEKTEITSTTQKRRKIEIPTIYKYKPNPSQKGGTVSNNNISTEDWMKKQYGKDDGNER